MDSIKEPDIIFSMVTENEYNYRGMLVLSRFKVTDDKIKVGIRGAILGCLCVIGPASWDTVIVIPEGTYTLEISYDGNKDSHIVTVTDTCFNIEEDEADFTKPEYPVSRRYRPNSFTYWMSTPESISWLNQDFRDSLLTNVNLQIYVYPDSGGRPYDYRYRDSSFIYGNEEQFQQVIDILENYTDNVLADYPDVGIGIREWLNRRYHSSDFRD
ncbi:hypothetical protein GF359_06260 [candidate division WOR-3 bacterium]|uniref:Uncharacterized protein n=1 Tax=candidate division WOR-3 bacterium TaxID=2052148 RepID=A0A9D5K9M5_UNCW3|nr:hypothetical protein [candidate division WOR-3 bacterium]MBD3364802.1 hypothetical protein [candidate division WOR-3 bacterium]